MNKTIYYLKTCSTCQRIMKEVGVDESWKVREIKSEPITEKELDWLKEKVGSYESLFSKRAMKYRSLGLHNKQLTEREFKRYILEEYTFLKRPVIVLDGNVFVGNSKKVIAKVLDEIKSTKN